MQRFMILVLPSSVLGLSIALYQYWDQLIAAGHLGTVLLVSISLIFGSVFTGYKIFQFRSIGNEYALTNKSVRLVLKNGTETSLKITEKFTLKETNFGMVVTSMNSKLTIPKQIECYEEIKKGLLETRRELRS
jgi:hypothetical protein